MENRSKVKGEGKVVFGLDLGDKHSYLYGLDAKGEFLEEGRLRTTPETLRERFGGIEPARVVMETGTHSPWLSRLLESLGHEVVVANSRELRLISASDRKTDRSDAKTLAELGYARPQLLRPIQPRPLGAQLGLSRIRARQSLVEARTKLVNHVRGAVKSVGGRISRCSTRGFAGSAREQIPEELKAILAPHLKLIEELSAEIREHDKAVEKISDTKYPETEVLRQVPGVGSLTALALVLVLVDPRRFRDSRRVGAYLGLTPRRNDSGEREPQLRITKAGDGLMRKLLVGSAHYVLGPFGPDTDLRRFGLELARRGGNNAKKRAVVAVARKLAVVLHRLWLTGEVYEPLRNAARRERRKGAAVGAESVETK
jgi:transposase